MERQDRNESKEVDGSMEAQKRENSIEQAKDEGGLIQVVTGKSKSWRDNYGCGLAVYQKHCKQCCKKCIKYTWTMQEDINK